MIPERVFKNARADRGGGFPLAAFFFLSYPEEWVFKSKGRN